MRILFVDDNPEISDLFRIYFRLAGHAVQCVSGGAKALEAIQLSPLPFDLVILDYHMPEMDGLETARLIRQTQTVPIILFTGHCRFEIEGRAREARITYTAYKPMSPSQLLNFAEQGVAGQTDSRARTQGRGLRATE